MEQQKSMELINKGIAFYNQKNFKKAQLIFSELIESNDSNPEAYYYLANIFHTNGEIGKAIKAFNKVLTLDPNHTNASIGLSVLYNDIGKYEDARKVFQRANEKIKARSANQGIDDPYINKKFSLKHYELAELYASYSRYDESLFEYQKAIALEPENLEYRLKVAKIYAKKGFMSRAIQELRKLKNECPSYMAARVALGILYYGNGNIIEAQNEWQNILAREPQNSEAAMYLKLSKAATETKMS